MNLVPLDLGSVSIVILLASLASSRFLWSPHPAYQLASRAQRNPKSGEP